MRNPNYGLAYVSIGKITLFILFSLQVLCLTAQTHTFPTFNPGPITSANPSVPVTSMPVTGLTGNYLTYELQADFTGTGGDPSISSAIWLEVTNGSGLVYVPESAPTSGGADNSNSTTLTYTGNFAPNYVGGTPLLVRIFDNDGQFGTFTSNITNVQFTITEIGGGETVTITGGGATTVTGTHPNFTISSTDTQLTEAQVDGFVANNGFLIAEVDGSVTNEIELPTGGMSGQVLQTDGSGVYTWVNQTADTDTDTQLTETQVDGFVANNGFLTAEVDGSITNEIELPTGGMSGQVLQTDGSGVYTWVNQTASSPWNKVGSDINFTTGNVGIGIASSSFKLQVAGNVDVTGELTAASDVKLKKNIQGIQNANGKVALLNPVSYHYRVDEFPLLNLASRKKMGLIAQEVERYFPNLVSSAGRTIKADGEEVAIMSVNYVEMIPMLIKAIQEHEVELELKDAQIKLLLSKVEKIDEIESELTQLRDSLSKLELATNSSFVKAEEEK